MTDILSDFFAETDVEGIAVEILETRGIDIRAVYCLHTGKRIGTYSDDELRFAIDENPSEDFEDIADDLIVRVVASMRPSPALNKPDRITLNNLASQRPVDCMAYLVNRLHGNRETLLKRGDHSFEPLFDRIRTYNKLASLVESGMDLTPWIHWLLELDAKMNLHDLTAPCYSMDRLNKWIPTKDGVSIFGLLDHLNHKDLLPIFESWVFDQLGIYDQRDLQLRKESAWFRGNTFAARAFVESTRAYPVIANRKLQAEYDKKQKDKAKRESGKPVGRPKSERTLRIESEVAANKGILDAVLDALLSGQATAPASTPKKPVLLTGNLLFAKKES